MTHHTRRRIVTVILAPVAALAAWGLTQLLGIGLDVTVGDGTVGPGDVFVYALVGALGGWAVVRLVEGHSRYPRSRWALIGSTTLHERIDAESARRVMDRYYAALRRVIEAHGGTVIKLLGDGVLAGFGLTRAREDDARRAVQAAMAAVEDCMTAVIANPTTIRVMRPTDPATQLTSGAPSTAGKSDGCKLSARPPMPC